MDRTARAAIFVDPSSPLEMFTLSRPVAGPGEVLVDVIACTLCGSDVHSFGGKRKVSTPTVLGHEILGRIAEFGLGASRVDHLGQPLAIGDRVTWAIVASCGDCFYCRHDVPQKCLRGHKYGHQIVTKDSIWHGGLADVCVLVPGTAIFRIPDDLPDAVACPANCATATVAAAIEAAGVMSGRKVVIMGAGMLGITACAMAGLHDAGQIICCELQPPRRELAQRFNASIACSPDELGGHITQHTEGHGVDIVLELTGATPAIELGLAMLRIGGTLVEVGAVFPTPALSLLPEQLVRNQWTLRGIHNYAPRHLAQAISFLAVARGYPFADLVSAWYPLAEAQAALEHAARGECWRVGVVP